MSVATKPGATVATAMPYGASATARDWPSAFSPALLAPYAGCSGSPRNAPRDETLTIRPPRSRMCWAAHQIDVRRRRSGWSSSVCRQRCCHSLVRRCRRSGAGRPVAVRPALLTSTSSPPSSSAAPVDHDAGPRPGRPGRRGPPRGPSPGSCARSSSAASAESRWWMATRSPPAANAFATARPIPREAPVTSTARSVMPAILPQPPGCDGRRRSRLATAPWTIRLPVLPHRRRGDPGDRRARDRHHARLPRHRPEGAGARAGDPEGAPRRRRRARPGRPGAGRRRAGRRPPRWPRPRGCAATASG